MGRRLRPLCPAAGCRLPASARPPTGSGMDCPRLAWDSIGGYTGLERPEAAAARAHSRSAGGRDMTEGKTLAVNRKAFHDYDILERYEAGLVLTGSEIKSVRAGKVDLRGAYARAVNGELWLFDAHIAPYQPGSYHNHEPTRPRKLLLHKEEMMELAGKVSQRGLTLVPLQVYIKDHVAKVEVALARGKRKYDKRQAVIEREMEREAQRAVRQRV